MSPPAHRLEAGPSSSHLPEPEGRQGSTRRHLLFYLVLVGFPLLGLLAVLRVGDGLTPVPHIHGEWRVETSGGAGACPALLGSGSVLIISQSGLGSEVHLPGSGTTGTLRLQEGHLEGSLWPTDPSACSPEGAVLSLRLVGEDPLFPRALVGTLSGGGCTGCADGEITLARPDGNPESVGTGDGH